MKVIDEFEFHALCVECGVLVQLNAGFRLTSGSSTECRFVIETEHLEFADLVLLANRLLWPEEDDQAPEGSGKPYAFWIGETGVWNDVHESIANEAFGALLKGHGQNVHSKGLLFEDLDRTAAVVFVLHVLSFAWDAYLLPLSGLFVLHLSHDGYIEVKTRDNAMQTWLHSRLSAWEAK